MTLLETTECSCLKEIMSKTENLQQVIGSNYTKALM